MGVTVEMRVSFVGNIDRRKGVCTIVEMETDCMFGENFCAHWNLAQADPWKDDGKCHDEYKPERRRLHKRIRKGLAGESIIIGE